MRPLGRSRTLPVGSTRPASRSAHSAGSLLTVRSSGGSIRCISAMARARVSPQYDTQRDHSQSGVLTRAASSAGGDRLAVARHAPEHGVGELVVALGLGIVLHQRHGEIDGRVRRRVQENELRRRRQQNGIERAGSLRAAHARETRRARGRADPCAGGSSPRWPGSARGRARAGRTWRPCRASGPECRRAAASFAAPRRAARPPRAVPADRLARRAGERPRSLLCRIESWSLLPVKREQA